MDARLKVAEQELAAPSLESYNTLQLSSLLFACGQMARWAGGETHEGKGGRVAGTGRRRGSAHCCSAGCRVATPNQPAHIALLPGACPPHPPPHPTPPPPVQPTH